MNQILRHPANYLHQLHPFAVLQQLVARIWCLFASQMLGLARFRVGRIVLHLIAILGDRCVGFHLAGILREVAEMSRATIAPLLLLQVRTRTTPINH